MGCDNTQFITIFWKIIQKSKKVLTFSKIVLISSHYSLGFVILQI